MLVLTPLIAQKKTEVSIKAQATVVDKAEIELVTIKDMDIDASMAQDGKIFLSAKKDAQAAVMMVKGKSNASFRVSFVSSVKIQNTAGKGYLSMRYELYGFSSENQSASEPIAAERTLKFSRDGKYYFWIGGHIDITNARPGNYNGEFTIEIEYI